MKRKVAIIDPLGSHGSSHHFYLFGQAQGLIENGMAVSLYTNKKTNNPKIPTLNFYQTYSDVFSSRFNFINGIKYIIGSTFSIFHARFSGNSLIHYHLFYTNILVFYNVLISRLLLAKVVITIHDVESFASHTRSSFFTKMIYKLSNLIFTHNIFSKNRIINQFSKIKEKTVVFPHGNYIPFIEPEEDQQKARVQLNIPREKKVLLFFGMVKKEKGLEILLEALKHVVQEDKQVLLLIAGKIFDDDFSRYQEIIDKNKLSEYCILHTKFIIDEDVRMYYSAANLVVLPYKKVYQSGVLMMALSFKKAVLVSDLPPLLELVEHGKSAFVFKSEDVDSLANQIISISQNFDSTDVIAKNGYDLIERFYNWDEIGRFSKSAYDYI